MATDKDSGTPDTTSPLAERLLSRAGRARFVGAGSALFRRLGLANPYEGGSVEDESREGGEGMFSFLSSKAYFDELRGLSAIRRQLLWRIDGARRQSRAGERLERSIATSSIRAAMSLGRGVEGPSLHYVDWSTQVDPEPALEASAEPSAMAGARGAARPARASAAERALRAQIAEASEVLAGLQAAARSGGRRDTARIERRVQEIGQLPEREQPLAARRAVRSIRGIPGLAARAERAPAEHTAVGSRPLAVAQGRASVDGPSKGLRPLLADSPILMTLEQPVRPAAPEVVASTPTREISRGPRVRTHAHRQLPVAGVAEEVRNQSATGRAGPPAESGAELLRAEGSARPTPSARALNSSRPTERIARVAVQTRSAPLTDLRRGLAAAGRDVELAPSALEASTPRRQTVAAAGEGSARPTRAPEMASLRAGAAVSDDVRSQGSQASEEALVRSAEESVRSEQSPRAARRGSASRRLEARVAARAEAGLPDASGRLTGGVSYLREDRRSSGSQRVVPDAGIRLAALPGAVEGTDAEAAPPADVASVRGRSPVAVRPTRVRSSAREVEILPPLARAVQRAGEAPSSERVGIARPPIASGRHVDRERFATAASPREFGQPAPVAREFRSTAPVAMTLAERSDLVVEAGSGERAEPVGAGRVEVPPSRSADRSSPGSADRSAARAQIAERSAQRALVADGRSRRGTSLPSVRAAARALAQERSGARGRLLSPSVSPNLSARAADVLSPPRAASLPVARAEVAGARAAPVESPRRLGGVARALERSVAGERVGPSGSMLAPRPIAAFHEEASPAQRVDSIRRERAAELGFSTLEAAVGSSGALDVGEGDSPAPGAATSSRPSLARTRQASPVAETRRGAAPAGRVEGERAGRAARRTRDLAAPTMALARPAADSPDEVRPGLASRASGRTGAARGRSALPEVTPERTSAASRRIEAARRAQQSGSHVTPSGEVEPTWARRTLGGFVERSATFLTEGRPVERTVGSLTEGRPVERTVGSLTEGRPVERTVGSRTEGRPVERTVGSRTEGRPVERTVAEAGAEGTLARAVRRAESASPDRLLLRPTLASASPDSPVVGSSVVGSSVADSSVGGSSVVARPAMERAARRGVEPSVAESLVPRPVASDRVSPALSFASPARASTSAVGASAEGVLAEGASSVAGGVRGVAPRPQGPGRSRMERALRAASAVHAGARETQTTLVLAAPQRALAEPSTDGPRRLSARIERDASGRLVSASVVDVSTGFELASPPSARARPVHPEADASRPVAPATWAEERGMRTVSARRRGARGGGDATRSARGAVRGPELERSLDALVSRPEGFASADERVAHGADGASSRFGMPVAERGAPGPLLRRRVWQRRGMAAELGTLAPALADADGVPAPTVPEGSPAWVRRAVVGTGDAGRVEGAPVAGQAPVASGRPVAGEPRQSGLMSALSRADSPQDLVQVIVQRSAEVPQLRGELPAQAVQIVDRIAQLGPEELSTLRRSSRVVSPDQARTLARGRSRNRKTSSEPHMLSSTHDGVGGGRLTKLADKLMNLIHLAENSRVKEAQDQVRMARDTTEARAEGGAKVPGMSVEDYDMNINALQRSVLDSVLEQFEELDSRREDPDGRNKWW